MNLQHIASILGGAIAIAGLSACGSTGPTGPITRPVPGQLSSAVPGVGEAARRPPQPSNAATPRDYKRAAAAHIYEINGARIHGGKLPPLLYAIGTLQVHLDANGKVASLHWLRAPSHAPEVIAEIVRTVLAASPFPVAARLGPVVWTDTWLWDDAGRFQLDTLSEGQL